METNLKINTIKGIGEKTEKLFAKLDIYTVGDLIEYFPKRYEEYTKVITIEEIKENNVVAIEGTVCKQVDIKKIKNLQIVSCEVRDNTGTIQLTWFNMPFLKNTLRLSYRFIFRGKVIRKGRTLTLEHPQILTKEEYYNKLSVLQAVYPLTEGLTNNMILKALKQIFNDIHLHKDYIPDYIRERYNLAELNFALVQIHFPKDKDSLKKARNRLVFNEFFLFTLALMKLKESKDIQSNKFVMVEDEAISSLIHNLPYKLTNAQEKVWNEIVYDLSGSSTMNRLVQGDVGSGKTIVAVLSLLMTIKNGHQGAIMVPTEVLAKQHFESISRELEPYGGKVILLVGSMSAKDKKEAYKKIESKEANVIVGTHALIQEKVNFNSLALVITDEQHRFGVKQREGLAEKGNEPHILVMSATPIPRTLAVILYGDLDISIINELPASRLPIKNCVVNTDYRQTAYKFIEKEVLNNRQAYVICPMVEESEFIEAENVIEYTQLLKDNFPPFIKIEYIHGKMKNIEKNEIMERFAANQVHILVSTTVIEVGINVPNATVMMIENAERFGLAQLHQLRGRVGRGEYQSYCILISGTSNKETKERLEILNKSNDGFYIASEDLKRRGAGDLFGIRQSGLMEFNIGDIYNDSEILKLASETAKELLNHDYNLEEEQHKELKIKLEKYLRISLTKLNI